MNIRTRWLLKVIIGSTLLSLLLFAIWGCGVSDRQIEIMLCTQELESGYVSSPECLELIHPHGLLESDPPDLETSKPQARAGQIQSQGGQMASRWSHDPEKGGSIPPPANTPLSTDKAPLGNILVWYPVGVGEGIKSLDTIGNGLNYRR